MHQLQVQSSRLRGISWKLIVLTGRDVWILLDLDERMELERKVAERTDRSLTEESVVRMWER